MDTIKRVEDLEQKIRAIARRYSYNFHELEDLEQIGRLSAWQVFEKKPDANRAYILNAVRWAIIDEKVKVNGKNRKYHFKISTLNLREGDERDIGDFATTEPELTYTEKIELIKSTVRAKFGGFRRIKNRRVLAQKIVRYMVEEVWKIDTEEIPKRVDYQLFVDSKLQSFLWTFYRNSPIRAITEAYPERFLAWQFKRVPNGFWSGEDGFRNAIDAVKWLCKKHNVTGNESFMPLSTKEFLDTGLGRMLHVQFSDSIFLALKAVCPELKQWRMKQVARGFYKDEKNQKIALESMLMELQMPSFDVLSPEEIYDHNTRRIGKRKIEESGLRGLLSYHGNCVYDIFDSIYPGKVKPWFFKNHNKYNTNTEETAAEAIRWLFERYLEIPMDEIPKYATCDLFWQVGFSGILTKRKLGLNSSPYRAVNLAFPGKFSKSEFNQKRETVQVPGLKDLRGSYGNIKRT